jgi:hypothetical protein
MKPIKITKEETLEEFLARGGVIQKIPMYEYKTDNMVKATTVYIPHLLDLSEGAMYYSEFKQVTKDRIKNTIDLSRLPKELAALLM